MRNLLGQSLIMALVIGSLLIVFASPLITLGLWLLDGSEVATDLAREYAIIYASGLHRRCSPTTPFWAGFWANRTPASR